MKREISALIFDVKKYAIHDGPGIRTTFFLKGCPLRCLWCQNPESMSPAQEVAFCASRCIGCNACREACCLIGGDGMLLNGECSRCGRCVQACVTGARRFIGNEYTPWELVSEALKDKIFYDASGGGITLSGGECLLHHEFVELALQLCRKNGLHSVIDTCGHVPWKSFERILGLADLYLYDVKLIDSGRHREYTGTGNELILSNLERLAALRKKIIVRVPLIPGYTDSPDDIRAIGDYIINKLDNRIMRVELLPYNSLAETKYANNTAYRDGGVGSYRPGSLTTQSDEYVKSLYGILSARGIESFSEIV